MILLELTGAKSNKASIGNLAARNAAAILLCCLLVRVAAAVGAVGNKARNNQALDLLGTFVNLENFGIAHQLFDGVFGVEAVSAKNLQNCKRFDVWLLRVSGDLHGVGRTFHGVIAGVSFGDGREVGVGTALIVPAKVVEKRRKVKLQK